jgi:hypothetical protein
MILYKILFFVFIFIVVGILGYILYIHSKYENIILREVKPNDRIPLKSDVYTIVNVCELLMEITFYDNNNKLHECTIGEFIKRVGCKNICDKYNKTLGKFDNIIMT